MLRARRNPLLADDMGTGKTPQTIGIALLLLEQDIIHNILVVCPKSVLWNWPHEFNNVMSPKVKLNAIIYYGPKSYRKTIQLSMFQVVFVTYETLRTDINRFKKLLWGLVVLDEVHKIRNADTAKSKAIMELNANFIVGLSGTPIVNSLADIHTVMKRLNPTIFGPREKFDFTYGNANGRYIESSRAYQEIKEKISGVMIRRDPERIMKELPEFQKIIRYISLANSEQGRNYDRLIEEGILEYEDLKTGEYKAIKLRQHVLALFTRLKQQANICFISKQSAKIDYLEEMFKDEIFENESANNKVVIFSQYKEPLQIMQYRFKDYRPLLIDGSVDPKRRQELSLTFNKIESPNKIMLAQMQACGEGINLDGGNVAVLFDLWWNEATHQQAFKRIRRMTQKRRQYFVYVICESTIEDNILRIIDRKQRAFEGVVGKGEGADGSTPTMEELEEILYMSGRTQKGR